MMKVILITLLSALLLSSVESFTLPSRRVTRLSTLFRSSTTTSGDDPMKDALEEKDAVIENLNIFIAKLQTQLEKVNDENVTAAPATTTVVAAPTTPSPDKELLSKIESLESKLKDTSNMLTKRDMLIENLEEELEELERQLKASGRFVEKKPPMKGRKVVGDEDDWTDPLQDVQGSLLFHLAMTLRLTVVTVFFRIPRFILSLPKRFMK